MIDAGVGIDDSGGVRIRRCGLPRATCSWAESDTRCRVRGRLKTRVRDVLTGGGLQNARTVVHMTRPTTNHVDERARDDGDFLEGRVMLAPSRLRGFVLLCD